jgi:protein-disulfide isomerase
VTGVGPSLGSALPPPIGPGDHVRGPDGAAEAILYLDLACPRCAATWPRIAALPLRLCVRHFPVSSKRPRSPDLHRAAEAAALRSEEAFWSFWDSLLADRSHVDDPHLWERAQRLGIDPAEFDRDRRSDAVGERVRRDFRSGIRAGVVSTPAAFAGGRALPGEVADALAVFAG